MKHNREKVINDLTECVGHIHKHDYDQFPFIAKCKNTMTDAITLLKEQESIIESLKSDLHETLEVVSGRLNVVRCKDCQLASMFETEDGQMFCECGATTDFHKPDWFCADGKRKDT